MAIPRDIYGAMGGTEPLGLGPGWQPTPPDFRTWLAANQDALKTDGIIRQFGNHRKYESMKTKNPGDGCGGTELCHLGSPPRTHAELFRALSSRRRRWEACLRNLYRSMGSVISFGRTAKFDYLTMIGKLNLAPIEPGPSLQTERPAPSGAPASFSSGVRPQPAPRPRQLDDWLVELDAQLGWGCRCWRTHSAIGRSARPSSAGSAANQFVIPRSR